MGKTLQTLVTWAAVGTAASIGALGIAAAISAGTATRDKDRYGETAKPTTEIVQRGLSTSPRTELTASDYSIPQISNNYALGALSEKETRYVQKSAVIWGKSYFSSPNSNSEENELEFILYAADETNTRINRKDKTIELNSKGFYIPTIETNENNGAPLKRVTLTASGPLGIKAKRTDYNIREIQTGILTTTQEDLQFRLETIKINDKEFFVPCAEENQLNLGSKLPFYLIPKEGAMIEVSPSPQNKITIENPGKIYRPHWTHVDEYSQRVAEQEEEKALEERKTPGQAEEVD